MPRPLIAIVFCFLASGAPRNAEAENVAFFYALDQDFQALKSQTQPVGQPLKSGGRTISVLQLKSHRVYAVKMGSGAVETALSAQALLARVHCEVAFSVGPVGSLSDKSRVGSWLRVREVVPYQKGAWTKMGFQMPSSATLSLTNEMPMKLTLPELFINLDNVKVASGEVFVSSDDYRAQLRETTGAEVVDMNLFGLVTACQDNHLPLVCWRVISDLANDQASEDFRKFASTYDGAGGKAVEKIIEALPADPNSPAAYPNINRVLADPTGSGTNQDNSK